MRRQSTLITALKAYGFSGLLIVFGLILSNRTEAALIADENFEYASGSLVGDNGGIGWNGAWYTSYGSASVNNQQATVAGTSAAFRLLAAPVTITPNTEVWFSFTAQELSPVSTYAGLSAFSGNGERGFAGDPNSGPTMWGLQPTGLSNSGPQVNSKDAANVKSLLVERYSIAADGTGTMTLWLNPLSMSQLINQDAVAVGTFVQSPMSFDRIRLASGNGAMSFSDIRIGTTAADVLPNVASVPEPGVGVMLGLGMLGIAFVRCYQKRSVVV